MIMHVLSDGTKTSTITGHMVKPEDVQAVYTILTNINKRRLEND